MQGSKICHGKLGVKAAHDVLEKSRGRRGEDDVIDI